MPSKRWLVVVLAVVALGVAHWMYWYAPRERPGRPDTSSLAGRVYLTSDLPRRVWLPYPHQNLARLERVVGRLDQILAEIGRVSGEPVPELPAFGGLRLPPASELALASDETGERFVMVAQVYPVAAVLSRWAGRLAGNPLLSGGETRIGDRVVEVRWEDGAWLASAGGAEVPAKQDPPAPDAVDGDALARLHLDRPEGGVPAGDYRLEKRGSDLELLGGASGRLAQLAELAGRARPLPLIRAEGRHGGEGTWCRVFALLPGLESVGGLPGAVTVVRGGEPFKLPGERLVEVIGDGVRRRQAGPWEIRALDRASLARGEPLVSFGDELEPYLPLDVALWIELRSADRLVSEVETALEAVPVIGPREAKRWREVGRLLSRLSHFERLTVLVSPSPAAVHVRLTASRSEVAD